MSGSQKGAEQAEGAQAAAPESAAASAAAPVIVRRDGAVAVVLLNRPEKRNALDIATRRAIADAFIELEKDAAVRAIVITGGPTVFAAGADLNFLVDKGAQDVADIDLGQYWAPVANSSRVTIAAVSGPALGAGCELAMMCDLIVADASARFGQPELMVGIMPGAGGTQRLVRAVGKQTANLMLLCGEPIDGTRAHQLGLVAELVDAAIAAPAKAKADAPADAKADAEAGADHPVLARALALARRAARMPPKAVRATRRVMKQGADLPLDAALALENREFLLLFDTADKTEGMRAFLDRRKADFTGR